MWLIRVVSKYRERVVIMYKVILENIVRFMNRKNLTQQELADKASISRVRVNQLLSQRRNFNPKLSTLVNIAQALDMDFIELSKRSPNLDLKFDNTRNFNEYRNIFIQNVKLKLIGKRAKSLSSYPGISESGISELLSGKVLDPQLKTLVTIAEQLETTLSELFNRMEKL